MLKYKKGDCSICKSKDVYIVKKLPSGNYCTICNDIRLNEGKSDKPFYHVQKKRNATGEGVLFQVIWDSIPPHERKCQVCKVNVKFSPITFSHILGKGAYPSFRLLLENISIMCPDCHVKWDAKAKSELVGAGWDEIKKREFDLKVRYNAKTR